MGYHIFTSDKMLPPAICEPIGRWASKATSLEREKTMVGGYNQPKEHWAMEMFSSDASVTRAFGLDTLPLVFTHERTMHRSVKLVLFWIIPPFILALLTEAIASFRSNKI